MLLPLTMLTNVLGQVLLGQQRWRHVIALRLISPVGVLTIVPILYVTDTLTVTTAAATSIALGVLPVPLLLGLLPATVRPRPNRSLMAEALSFGFRAWPGSLADLANQRLDQLIMIPLLPPRELGLYAVATTVAAIGTTPATAVAWVIFPRIASGQLHVVGPAFRITGVALLLTQGVVALAAPLLVPLVFGSSFQGAVSLILILLPAWLLTALAPLLAHALAASGHPGPASVAQILGLLCTALGLAFSLPQLGATGAAITSLGAATVVVAYLLRSVAQCLGLSIKSIVRPLSTDRQLARMALRTILSRRHPAG
jgi:O-antigen/teichoic acid export membrane protein